MKRFIGLLVMIFFVIGNVPTTTASITPSESLDVEPLNETQAFTNVVIFIRFNDEASYTAPYNLSYYESMFNGVDTVSLRDYYLEVSYNQLTIDSYLVTSNDQIVYVTDIRNRGYYEPYHATSNPEGYETETERTNREMDLLKRTIDFVEDNNLVPDELNLDANNDGAIDSITFLVSGNAGDWNVLLWPHKWELFEYYDYTYERFETNAPSINGKYAFHYTFELLGSHKGYDYAVNVSILAHETFHLISAPDLYHYYRYDWIAPVGDWGLMEDLSSVPRHMLGYMKYQYGQWIDTVDEISEDGTYTLYPLQDSPDNLFRIDTGYSSEYVYLEYRDDTGRYESNVPQSGLLVYRVDLDYIYEGNEEGYYLSDNTTPQDEVFVFRPGIEDTIEPIVFSSSDAVGIDEDGAIEDAALSQNNPYDAMGIGTDIIMFHSDGTIMNITISNVTEHDGYITFDISFNTPQIILNTDFVVDDWDAVTLLDVEGAYYSAVITGVSEEYDVYYTTDGSTPTTNSTEYTGEDIVLTSSNNYIRAIVVKNGTTIYTIEQLYSFSTSITTNHINYGDNVLTYWYVGFQYLTDYDVIFNAFFELTGPEDRLIIHETTDISTTYTDTSLADETLSFTNYGVLFTFLTDGSNNDAYGISATVDVNQIFETVGYFINGDEHLELNIDEDYIEYGITIVGDDSGEVYFTTEGSVDSETVGEYVVTYTIYDGTDQIIDTLQRVIDVNDYEAPVITLIGNTSLVLDVFDPFVEPGFTVSDNSTVSSDVQITTTLDTSVIGTYIIRYVVTDDNGNISETVSRYVHVVDQEAPTVVLNPAVDTIVVGDVYIDTSVLATDNYSETLTIEVMENTIDTAIPGTYHVLYRIADSSNNTTYMIRYVHVLETSPSIEFSCEPGITTYKPGELVDPLICTINGTKASINVESVNTNLPGIYPVYYTVLMDQEQVVMMSYIFILDDTILKEAAIVPKKEDYL